MAQVLPLQVLLVDDNASDRADAKAALLHGSSRRYEFIEAALGEEALALCACMPQLDCVVLDFDLPDADAFDVLARLPRDADGVTLVPVVILTGSPRQALNQAVLRAGAQDYVGKSWLGAESLTRAVENAIERHAMKYERRLDRARQQLIAEVAQAAAGGSGDAMESLFERVRVLVQADIFFSHIAEAGPNGPLLRLNADAGIDDATRQQFMLLDAAQTLCGEAVLCARTVFRNDLQQSDEAIASSLRKLGVRAYASYPLRVEGRVIGSLSFASRTHTEFGADERDFMALVAGLVGAAWERIELLRLKENQFQILTDNSPDILTRFDRQLRHVFVNAAVTLATGLAPADFIGKSNRELGLPEPLCVLWEQAMSEVFETGLARRIDFSYTGPAGLRHYECDLVAEQRAGGGPIAHILGVTHDVTERHQIDQRREQLLGAERAARIEGERVALIKDEFLATLSHELRTPLAAIMGWSGLLRRAPPTSELVQRAMDAISRSANDQAALINDLLDMNRITSGKLRVESQPIDIIPIAAAAIDTLTPAAQAKGITLDLVRPSAAPIMVLGDGARLQQVLWNLLANAVKFTPAGGNVRLEIRCVDGQVALAVTDNGKGIEPAFLPYLFDRFSQADGGSARVHGGLGLGLAIVKNLLELQGGSVSVMSGGRGKGACFTAWLPLLGSVVVPAPVLLASPASSPLPLIAHQGAADEPTAAERGELHGISILLVDDRDDALELGRRLLTEYGASVTTAQSATEALWQLRQRVPDLLLSDIGMPDTDGYELIEQVRNVLCLKVMTLPAVAVTAYDRPQDHERALKAGFQACIGKPVQPQILVRTLLALLATQKA